MQISFEQKKVTLAIGEFSEFTDSPSTSGGSGRGGGFWRAQVGQAWHTELRNNLARRDPSASFEVTIAAVWPHGGWLFEFQGRADQVIRDDRGVTLREIKTVDHPLPAHEETLVAAYPAYFLQARTYQRLYPLATGESPLPVRAELVFVEIQTGMTQVVSLEPETQASDGFLLQLGRIHRFVELRREHLQRLREFAFLPPFEASRPGQEEISARMESTCSTEKVTLFEAPTGFGKTGVVLEYALNRLRRGAVTRILFLTSKATGQIQAAKQLRQMLGGQPTVSFMQVRNKAEHCVNSVFHCFREVCPFLDNLEERWNESGLARLFAADGALVELGELRENGRNAGICPYEITRATLPLVDVWIGDYNYVFSPSNRGLFFNQPGFTAADTLLIIDEAHNLPSRVCDVFSASLSLTRTLRTMGELEMAGAAPGLLLAWEKLLDLLSHLEACEELPAPLEGELRAAVVRVCEQLLAQPLDYPRLGPDLTDRLMEIFSLRQALENDQVERLLWSPERGELRCSCLSAGPFIAATLRQFGQVVMMSATFGPPSAFAEACGLGDQAPGRLVAEAPWRASACDVAIDARVDTRLRSRLRHYSTTAATVNALVERSPTPVVVFFSSYRYAEEIRRRLEEDYPAVRVALQERGLGFPQQASFVEENLVLSDALFLILGSSYAESIDLLGGRVAHAMVVGPALPEVNALQKARMKKLDRLTQAEAFHSVYQIPAMQRVNQALGRLVRAPGHRTSILLHCQRFVEKSYADLLHPDHQTRRYILTDDDLESWLTDTAGAPL
jgi:DNA excision repair protein ERCC-2